MEFGTFSSHWKVDSRFPRRLNWSASLVQRQALFHWLAWFCGRVRLGCSFAQSQLCRHLRICMVSCSQQGTHSLGGTLFYITPKSILNFNYFVCRPALKKDTSACLKSLKKDWCTIKFSTNKKVRTWRCWWLQWNFILMHIWIFRSYSLSVLAQLRRLYRHRIIQRDKSVERENWSRRQSSISRSSRQFQSKSIRLPFSHSKF